MVADAIVLRTTYGRLQTVVWNSRGQHEYLLIYSFESKSAFGRLPIIFFAVYGKRIHPTAKVSEGLKTEEVNRKSPRGNDGITYTDPERRHNTHLTWCTGIVFYRTFTVGEENHIRRPCLKASHNKRYFTTETYDHPQNPI